MRTIFALALNTWWQFVRDRIFYIVLVVALFLLGFSYFLSSLTIVESRKILLDFGFSAISIAGVLTSVFIGVVAMAREVDSRTIYTILTKPVSRSVYVLGKFLGGALVLAVSHFLFALAILSILHLSDEKFPSGFYSCVALIFMENLIILGAAFFCSSFLNSTLAASITVSIFLIGRSSLGLQTMSERAATPEIRAIAKALYYTFPNLERFNIRDVVAYEKPYPESMLWMGAMYLFFYLLFCLTSSCLIFQKRDLP